MSQTKGRNQRLEVMAYEHNRGSSYIMAHRMLVVLKALQGSLLFLESTLYWGARGWDASWLAHPHKQLHFGLHLTPNSNSVSAPLAQRRMIS